MIHSRALELIAALRSGKYRQAKGALRKGNAFCCLGVACDISGLADWNNNRYDYEALELPRIVRDYFDFFSEIGSRRDWKPGLAELNDSGKTFAEIADYIEQNWEQL